MIARTHYSHTAQDRIRCVCFCTVVLAVALSAIQMAARADEDVGPRVSGLRGATPGVTTKTQLLASEHWGEPRKSNEDTSGKEYLLYTIGRFQVAVTVADSVVQSLDVRFPAQTTVAVVAEGFSLGKPNPDMELPPETQIGLAVPREWTALHYPDRCAVVYTKPAAAEVAMVRLYAYTKRDNLPTCTSSQESEAACLKGIDHLKKLHLDDATAAFAESIRHDPKHHCPYLYRSECHLRQGNNDEALADIRIAISLADEEAFCHARLAHVLNQKGDHTGAVAAANRAVELDAEGSYGYAQRGFARHKLGKITEARADYDRVVELTPEDFSAYTARADFLTFRSEYRGALKDANKAIELAPDEALPYCLRAFCRGNLRDFRGALADATKAIELDPNYAYAYEIRAKAYTELHDHRRAAADRKTAARLGKQ